VNKRYARRYQFFANYTWSQNKSNASAERDTDTFFGPQDPFNLNLDYGTNGLDITHQFTAGAVVDLPWHLNWSTHVIAHSGLAYPAYITADLNGDGVSNQGFGTNDRPTVQIGSGKPFFLPLYPAASLTFSIGICALPRMSSFESATALVSAPIFSTSRTPTTFTPTRTTAPLSM